MIAHIQSRRSEERSRRGVLLLLLVWLVILVSAQGGLAAAQGQGVFREAPILAERVAAGELPPVSERLPENPLVVQPVHKIGVYGGTWRRMAAARVDLGLNSRLGYETLLRWDRDGVSIIPNIVERMEVRDEARTFVFHLRKGMRWSDGHPFTSADFRYQRDYYFENKELSPAAPDYLLAGGELYELETPDDHTVVIRFKESYGLFPQALCFRGRQNGLFAPAHYLKQFHVDFNDKEALNVQARTTGFTGWNALYANRSNLEENPDCPTLSAWQIVTPFPAARCLAVRNPYYWKVDPAGNQLPYIDEIAYTTVLDRTVLNLKAIAGDIDFQTRHIDTANFTLFMQSASTEGYHVNVGWHDSTTCVYLNQSSRDPDIGPLLRNRDFRLALSLAINREELVDIVYSGLARIDAGIVIPGDPFYDPRFDDADYTRFDPQRANQLLDELGLERGGDGIRRLPNGEAFRQILHIYPSEQGSNADFWQLIADYWREVGLHFTVKIESPSLSVLQVRSGTTNFWCYNNASMHWAVDEVWKVPVASSSYYAPLYGRYFETGGSHGVAPPPEHQRLVDWYLALRSTPDDAERAVLAHRILTQWQDECYIMALCRPAQLTIISNRFHNVPEKILHNYRLMTPGYIGVEQFYIDESQPPVVQGGWREEPPEPPSYLYQPAHAGR